MNYQLSLCSRNVKTGPIPVSMSHKGTCPAACPFRKETGGGCYAATGPLSWIWAKVSDGRIGGTWAKFLAKVGTLATGRLWRHNQAGDLRGDGEQIDFEALKELVAANSGKRGYTYTHYDPSTEGNAACLRFANTNGFTVNLSSNSLAHADALKATGAGPVVTVLPSDFKGTGGKTPAGNRFIVCPSQTKGITCAKCQLCQRQHSVIIGFLAHGTQKKKVDCVANKN